MRSFASIVSHGTETDPVFWFANRAAQGLWEMDWARFTRTPSRLSAEPDERATRAGQAATFACWKRL